MKYRIVLLLVAICALLPISIRAQVITWSPLFPTREDSVTIIFDATQGTGGLADASPPIYAHTGVITNLSASSSDWRYVIAPWNVNLPKAQLTPLGNNRYQLGIRINTYYEVPQSEDILKLAMVFRNSDGSKEGKDVGGLDIFLPIYSDEGLYAAFSQPAVRPYIAHPNEEFTVEVQTSTNAIISIYEDGELITSGLDVQSLNVAWTAASEGQHWIKYVASNSLEEKTDSFFYVVAPPNVVEELPEGMKDGVNYIDNQTAVLVLAAPEKQFVYYVGDLNNWQLNPAYQMKQTPDGNRFWLQLNNLVPQQEYRYQFAIDGTLRVADPCATKVLDGWNDGGISATTYPNLISYPANLPKGFVSVMQTAQTPYNWQVANFTPPAKTDLVVYELLIRDFVSERNYQTLLDTLPYLQQLGINAIELMPVMEFEGNDSWGYNGAFFMALDKYYGTPLAFKTFVDTCHARGIAVILDIALNHAFGQNPYVQMYPLSSSPYFNVVATHPFSVGYDFNHDSPFTEQYVDRIITYWLDEYHIDGYRFDLSKGFTQTNSGTNVDAWGNYDASRIANLERIADVIWDDHPNAYVILEHFAANNEEQELSNYGMMLWGNSNYNYSEAAMGWINNSNFDWVSYKKRNWNNPHLVGYMESHDEERLMFRTINYGNHQGSYDTRDFVTAIQRMKMAATFFFTVPGPKMMWQFGELAYDKELNDCRLCPKPILWSYYDNWYRRQLFKVYQALIQLKKDYPTFETADFSLSTGGAAKVIKLNHADMNIVVAGNFGVTPTTITPNFQTTGTWYDYFSGESINVSAVTQSFFYQPGEFHLYTSVALPMPEVGIATGIETVGMVENSTVWAYPNPSTQSCRFSYTLASPAQVSLYISDAIGREVIAQVGVWQPEGKQYLDWNGNDSENRRLPDGLYIYRLVANGQILGSGKLLLEAH